MEEKNRSAPREPWVSATIGGRDYRVARGNGKFWRKVSENQWEPHTFVALERLLEADSVYLDVGGWVGPTVLFAAARCQTVYCIEPDPVAYERLLANLRMNGVTNVRPFHGALGAANAAVHIANEQDFGNSETRVRAHPGDDGFTVLAMNLSRLVDWWGIERIDLVKMDIEGAEFDLIPSLIDFLSRFKPPIHLSLHAPFLPPSERRDNLAAVVDLAGRYNFCYDKRLTPIPPREILTERFSDHFNAVVMSDVAL